jgi:hypothetical protein
MSVSQHNHRIFASQFEYYWGQVSGGCFSDPFPGRYTAGKHDLVDARLSQSRASGTVAGDDA